jgi:aspartokinase/homoserine dehydrogenase 1
VLIGARGQVGSALRQRLARQHARIAALTGLDLRLLAAFDRRGFAFDLAGLEPERLGESLQPRRDEDLHALFSHLARPNATPTLVIDCTASEDIAERYPDWLASGLGIVTANKRANARDLAFYRTLRERASASGVPYRFETTVGAAIPLLGPLRDLSLRGERVVSIQGVLSGSLSFLLERLHAGVSFSDALSDAQALGYTEPDPGEDLRAEDLTRKLLVLAREAGFDLEPEQVDVTPFSESAAAYPSSWRDRLAIEDAVWAARIATAKAQRQRWVIVAEVDRDGARVALRTVPDTSPFATLPAGQNLVRIETELQGERPLWLGGPGAGPEITAAGVLSDVIDAAGELAARRYGESRRRIVLA